VSPLLEEVKKAVVAEKPEKIVRLTFDDGPVLGGNTPVAIQGTHTPTPLAGKTPAVLDVLLEYGVKGTFFVVGEQVRKYSGLVRKAYSEGHSVQNHSYTHPDLTKLTNAEIARELRATNQAITEAGVPRPYLFRPPYGFTNFRVRTVGAFLGLIQRRWSDVPSEDWEDPPASVICRRVVSEVRPGSVVLLHDGSGANTDDALPCIIKELRAQGYGFGKLDWRFTTEEARIKLKRLYPSSLKE
jgi:peptidoglycan-N-acetylglucosamine deacetylase